jgi:nitrate reductase assembly molybdenum cofactor insertion protein NarJ
MAKKSSEAKKIVMQIDKEFEKFESKVAPEMHRRARGRLHRLKRVMNRMKPLKVKSNYVSMAERDIQAKLNHVKSQIAWAKKKSFADKGRIVNLNREMQRLRKEVPQLNKNVRSWSSLERKWLQKHKSVWRDLTNLQRRILKEEKRKAKVVKALEKYFK